MARFKKLTFGFKEHANPSLFGEGHVCDLSHFLNDVVLWSCLANTDMNDCRYIKALLQLSDAKGTLCIWMSVRTMLPQDRGDCSIKSPSADHHQ